MKTMIRLTANICLIIAVMVPPCTAAESNNFPEAFTAAMQLKAKPAEAEAAFVKLAESQEAGTYQKMRQANAWFQAADSAGAQGQIERASALADKIPEPALKTLAKMKLLERQKKFKEIMDVAKNENIAAWPGALVFEAAMCRAAAAIGQTDFATAEADLILAGRFMLNPTQKADAKYRLGNLYRDNIKDDAKAMQAYDELLAFSPLNFRYYYAAMSYARLAAKNNRAEDGLKRLGRLSTDITKQSPYFTAETLECYGDVYSAMGKKDEALASYRKVIESEFAPEHIKKAAKTKMERLTK